MALYPPLLPTKLTPRGDFDPAAFRLLVAQLGQPVTWEIAAICPCGEKLDNISQSFAPEFVLGKLGVSGEPRTVCATCAGKGWYLHSAQTIKLVVQDMSVNPRRFGVSAEYAIGRARISFLPENRPALGDRITLTTSVQRINELAVRKAGATQALRFPIATQTQDLATGQISLRVLQAQKALDNQSVAPMVEGVAFTVNGSGHLVWNDLAGAPAVDEAFSITYLARPRYVVETTPYSIRDSVVHHKTPAPVDTRLPVFATALQEYRGDGVNRGY